MRLSVPAAVIILSSGNPFLPPRRRDDATTGDVFPPLPSPPPPRVFAFISRTSSRMLRHSRIDYLEMSRRKEKTEKERERMKEEKGLGKGKRSLEQRISTDMAISRWYLLQARRSLPVLLAGCDTRRRRSAGNFRLGGGPPLSCNREGAKNVAVTLAMLT